MTTVMAKHKAVLDKLGLEDVNAGACAGPDDWILDPNGKEFESLNPTTGEPIAKIIQATPATYEKVMAQAHEAFLSWRTVPASGARTIGSRSRGRASGVERAAWEI